ncbi:MAG TPA: hypothetical protein VMH87_08640 [Pseudomonadales bacterium]|nr:hypothetical protein [Pseudomonadales bacterium]
MKPIEKYFPILQKSLAQHEKEHPHWQIELLVSLIKWGLERLRYNIEEVPKTKITWDNPFVELHYPITWNWQRRSPKAAVAPGGHIFGKITARNTATKNLANKTLSRIMVNQFFAMALANATNWAWYEKLKNYYTPVLPVQLAAELSAINDEQKRRERFEEFVRPFSIGVQRLNWAFTKSKWGKRIPKNVSRKLADSRNRMDINPVKISGEVRGRKFEAWLAFEIQPMIADYDRKKAYHPIVIGLGFTTRLEEGQIVEDSPTDWPASDREKFWEGLLANIGKLKDMLIPKVETLESIVLPVNAKLKISAELWRPENRSATIKLVADVHGQIGEIVEFTIGQPDNIREQPNRKSCDICGWIHDAGFTQIRVSSDQVISLGGALPNIVAVVHRARERGLPELSTKDDELVKICGSYGHPSKAFNDLNHADDYKILFVRRRGFVSLSRAFGISPE